MRTMSIWHDEIRRLEKVWSVMEVADWVAEAGHWGQAGDGPSMSGVRS